MPTMNMSVLMSPDFTPFHPSEPQSRDVDVMELHLLLPLRQVEAVEQAAQARGMTTGQMLRKVLSDLFPEREN